MAEATHTDTSADRASTGPTRAPKIADVPQAAPLEMSPGRSFAPRSGLARALAKADAKRRAEVVLELQQTHGNAFVQRLLEGSDAHIGNGRQAPAFPVVPGHAALNAGQVKWGRHADFPGTMGQTYYAHNDIEIWPSFRAVTERSIWPWGWQANIAKTDAAGGVWDAIATPENEEGYKLPYEHKDHPGYELYVRESGAAANNVAKAEQQHIDDLDTGWDLTGLNARRAINEAADEEPEVKKTEYEAKQSAVNKVAGKMGGIGSKIKGGLESGGRLESSLGPIMDESFVQSKSQRDGSGKHKIPVNYVMEDDQNMRVLYEVDPEHTLDSTPSSSVVNPGTIGG